MTDPIRVLIVDDSAVMRRILSSMIEHDPRLIVVGKARCGEEVLEKIAVLDPDVVTLDIEMPGMGGLAVLQAIMATMPRPVIMVSALTTEGAQHTLEALDLGAVDYVAKHFDGSSIQTKAVQQALIAKILAVAPCATRYRRHRLPFQPHPSSPRAERTRDNGLGLERHQTSQSIPWHLDNTNIKLVAIGSSTGGPQALGVFLPQLPKNLQAGLVIAQHMPKSFTKAFADRLGQQSQIQVREAVNGDRLEPGLVLVAPGGLQLRIARRHPHDLVVKLEPNHQGLLHAPSIDTMMSSVAQVAPSRLLGVILTGMGHDGLEGARAIKSAGGTILAQDEATSTIYGMPKAVIEANLADHIVPIEAMAQEVCRQLAT